MAFLALLVFCLVGLSSAVLPDNWASLSALDKQTVMWNNLVATNFTTMPYPRSVAPDGLLYNSTFLEGAFDQSIEEMQPGRPKIVGTNGVDCKADFIVNNASVYTGMFKAGSTSTSILRLSSNTGVNLELFVAIKMFVNGNTSQHLHLIHDVIGWAGPTADLFQWPMQTQVPSPLPVDYADGRYSSAVDVAFDACVAALPGGPLHRPPNGWGLGNVEQAAIDNNNNVLTSGIIAPFIVQVTPNPAIRPFIINVDTDDWRVQVITRIPANTKLYTVQAMKSPCDPYEELGEIWTRTEFIASSYGDSVLKMSQPYEKWSYGVAAPGVYCSMNPDALTVWSTAEANEIEALGNGTAPDIGYGNSPSAINGSIPAAGVGDTRRKTKHH